MARGGYRPGSGPKKGAKYRPRKTTAEGAAKARPPKTETPPEVPADIEAEAKLENKDPLTYMLDVMNSPGAEKERRDRMAIAAAPFVHSRKGEGKGKKEEKADRAKQAGAGKFAPSKPPLALVK